MSQNSPASRDLGTFVRDRAKSLGFHAVGIAKAGEIKQEAQRLRRWLDLGRHGGMSYLERWYDVRADPRHPGMVGGAKSVVSLGLAMTSEEPLGIARHLARYAQSADYHRVVRKLLKALLRDLEKEMPGLKGRALVDSAPLLERAWAARAGLGWIGKNSCLINPSLGSFFVLGELVVTAELPYDEPRDDDRCGDCRRCIDACPTGALSRSGRVLDARRCLSYWTVEAREPMPQDIASKLAFFGCDRCQDVCPWNEGRAMIETPLSQLRRWRGVSLRQLSKMSLDEIEQLIEGTALERSRPELLKRRAREMLP